MRGWKVVGAFACASVMPVGVEAGLKPPHAGAGIPAHRARAFLDQIALGVGRREQHAEVAIREGVADQEGRARIEIAAEIVVRALEPSGDGELVEVEGPRGTQVDRGAQRAFLDLGRRRSCAR